MDPLTVPLPEVVTTPQLTIRRWTISDASALHQAVTDSMDHLRPFMDWAAFEPVSRVDRVARIEQWERDHQAGGDAVYGVFRHGEVVGGCGLHRRDGPASLEIGYWVHVDHLRRGYATELARGLTEAALDRPDIDRIEIHHDKANTYSGRVPAALGYRFVEERPIEVKAPGQSGISWVWRTTVAGQNEEGP